MKKHRIAPEVSEQIINRIKNDGVTVAHGVLHQTRIKKHRVGLFDSHIGSVLAGVGTPGFSFGYGG